jgi:hypothetical protein
MEFFETLIEYLGTAVLLLGVCMAAIGGIQYGLAHASDDAAKKTSGMHTVVGGIVVGVIGIVIMPLVTTYFPNIGG